MNTINKRAKSRNGDTLEQLELLEYENIVQLEGDREKLKLAEVHLNYMRRRVDELKSERANLVCRIEIWKEEMGAKISCACG